MLINSKNLIRLRVETKSGQELGYVRDFDLNIDNLEVEQFYVRPAGIVKGLVLGDLILNKSSIISINEEKMIVQDLVGKELVRELSVNTLS